MTRSVRFGRYPYCASRACSLFLLGEKLLGYAGFFGFQGKGVPFVQVTAPIAKAVEVIGAFSSSDS